MNERKIGKNTILAITSNSNLIADLNGNIPIGYLFLSLSIAAYSTSPNSSWHTRANA